MNKRILITLTLILLVLFFGCVQETKKTIDENKTKLNENNVKEVIKLKAKNGDVVLVDYIGFFNDGNVFDSSIKKEAEKAGIFNNAREYKPLEVTIGSGKVIKGFNDALIGMKEGEEKVIKLKPSEAYGEKEIIMNVDLNEFKKARTDVNLVIGSEFMTGTGLAKIIAINDKNITINIPNNNPLAGKELNFKLKLISIIAENNVIK